MCHMDSTSKWVKTTLAEMSMEECAAQLLCPKNDWNQYTPEVWEQICRTVPIGCVFFTEREDKQQLLSCIDAIHQNESLPIVIAADMEQGLGAAFDGLTIFPRQMALGATADPDLAERMGRALAKEARSLGIHWAFSPVVDPNINFNNPVTNVRAFSDDLNTVLEFAIAKIRGLQKERLVAATAKHFPGDGLDDRDQHLCTSINPLAMDKWHATYGKIWKAIIKAGVQAIMPGHISLPQYQGCFEHPEDAMPATLSEKLQKDLLRNELGFKGLVISDASSMIGITSRVKPDEEAIENIRTGSDVYLFADPYRDFDYLIRAICEGKISKKQVRKSAERVLRLKAWLGLHENREAFRLTQFDLTENQRLADQIAQKAATLLKPDQNLPAQLEKGSTVLTVNICHNSLADTEMTVIDEELRSRGYRVKNIKNPDHYHLIQQANKHDRVFVNIQIAPHGIMGTVRLVGDTIMPFWRAFWVQSENAVFTSFGSPYIMYDLPHAPNMLVMYDNSPASQKAAVKAWLGEITCTGKCPVKLPSFKDKIFL